MKLTYKIHDISPYINWIYFFHAWGFQPRFANISQVHGCDVCKASWLTTFNPADRPKASEAMQLYKEAHRMLDQLDSDYTVHALFKLCRANSDGDNLLLDGTRLPLLRQQVKKKDDSPYLCLSDFVRPLATRQADTVGIFATCVDHEIEQLYATDPYKRLLVQTLADRLAEAATEKMHEEVRKHHWGYAPDESLSMTELHQEAFQGIRPAVGYPSLPDQSINFLLNDLLHFDQIGMTLTENGAMKPHASVCGLMLSHPAAHYFSIGKIDEDQLLDYAQRRGKPIEEIRKFLAGNLE